MTDPYDEHHRLFSDNGLKLGRVLWYLLHASQALNKMMYAEHTTNGPFTFTRLTEFGEEVGKDEIHWWIYKKETNLQELLERVEQVLQSVQALKEASGILDAFTIKTYVDLVDQLATFMEAHQTQIDELYQFVTWLNSKDPLAPSILFSYRVWGSTRRSDRWLELSSTNFDEESDQIIRILTATACGLVIRCEYTRSHEEMVLGAELYDSDPENYGPREISESTLTSRTAYKALKAFAIFFEELRDSLRNIKLDIEKCMAEKDLLKSESFWRAFIEKARAQGRVESELWDFKESLGIWHSGEDAVQVDFCKRIAAFANKAGGAIIVGVRDTSREVVGVSELENRLKSTSQAIQRWLDYPNKDSIFHLQPVFFENVKSSCLVVAVAQATDIVGVRGSLGEYYYPDRDQTGLVYRERQELENRKGHLKAGDNFGFIKELEAFLYDR